MSTGKTIALTRWNFVGKVMSLIFNMLSRLIITFLPRSNHLSISWLRSPSTVILKLKKIKFFTVSTLPIYLPWSDGTWCYDLSFLNESCVLFFSGQNEDCSQGDSTQDSPEILLQRDREEGQYLCDFGKGWVHAIKNTFFNRKFQLVSWNFC